MNSLLFSFLAASSAAFSNWLFRKNSSAEKNSSSINGYLFCFYFFSFISSLIITPGIWHTPPNITMLSIGGAVGVFNIALMLLTFRALTKGPAGLTFAFQNASAIFPGIILFLFFGLEFGFTCSYSQVLGIVLVVFGLFLGAQSKNQDATSPVASKSWLKYAIACLAVQVIALTCIQGRCVLFEHDKLDWLTPLAVLKADDIWFMPGQFGIALLLQTALFGWERRKLKAKEILFGTLAGIANCISTGLLLLATKFALPSEQGILFPLFAVSTIILCNLWATLLYKEKFNYAANGVCALGIFIGL